MNDLSKKRETDYKESVVSENTSYASEEILYKKLGAYLLLIYQSYLKRETRLEVEIKAALLSMVHCNQDYALKIRMMQLDYLEKNIPRLEGKWDEGSDVLFPIEESVKLEHVSDKQEMTLKEYKEIVSELLNSPR